ncbi:MAG TPA: c-type cytochrome [Terracidiphilus sp.]|jgi:mono/diheme cytochrome c family protein
MLNRLFTVAMVTMLAATMGSAETSRKIVINAGKTSPADGPNMYKSYCASCHGVNGKGNGPVASQLKSRPTDLTKLAVSNQNKFPAVHVIAIIDQGSSVQAHGSAEMPVWGPIFASMNKTTQYEKHQRESNLSRYLEALQVKQ